MTVLSVHASPAELRGFECRIGLSTIKSDSMLFRIVGSGEDYMAAYDAIQRLANAAHEQQEADEERDKAAHRCGRDIFGGGSNPG